uniref:hypothetical protein n=1 Tax=Streptomyces rimosus TaxID=1927 RepID=UPI000B1080BE
MGRTPIPWPHVRQRPHQPQGRLENKLHQSLCAGQNTLAQVQQAIATDWTTALTTLHLT